MSGSRVRHRGAPAVGWLCVALCLCCACATATTLAGKAVWFAVETGVRTTAATARGVTRIVGIGGKQIVNLTVDAATRLWAEQESTKLAELFWTSAERGAIETCYTLLSDELKKKLSRYRFEREAAQWAGRIRLVQLHPAIVRPDHVEVPAELSAPSQGAIPSTSVVRLIIIPAQGEWKVLSWIIQR